MLSEYLGKRFNKKKDNLARKAKGLGLAGVAGVEKISSEKELDNLARKAQGNGFVR